MLLSSRQRWLIRVSVVTTIPQLTIRIFDSPKVHAIGMIAAVPMWTILRLSSPFVSLDLLTWLAIHSNDAIQAAMISTLKMMTRAVWCKALFNKSRDAFRDQIPECMQDTDQCRPFCGVDVTHIDETGDCCELWGAFPYLFCSITIRKCNCMQAIDRLPDWK